VILAPCSGAVKAWPGSMGARGKACTTASLDRPLHAARLQPRRSGRRNGRQAPTKEHYKMRKLSMM